MVVFFIMIVMGLGLFYSSVAERYHANYPEQVGEYSTNETWETFNRFHDLNKTVSNVDTQMRRTIGEIAGGNPLGIFDAALLFFSSLQLLLAIPTLVLSLFSDITLLLNTFGVPSWFIIGTSIIVTFYFIAQILAMVFRRGEA